MYLKILKSLVVIFLIAMCTPKSDEKEDSDLPQDPFQPEIPAIISPVEIPKITLPVSTDVNAWLITHPEIAETVVWFEEDKGWVPWSQWSSGLKQLLQDAYQFALNGSSIATTEPLINHAVRTSDEAPVTALTFSDARDLFFSQITWSMLIDIQGLVPWKLEDNTQESLALLFDGREYFDEQAGCLYKNGTYDADPTVCYFKGMRIKTATITPAPGHWTYGLLLANNLIGSTQQETVTNVCKWTTEHFGHIDKPNKTGPLAERYGYEGIPPLINVINAEPFVPGKDIKPMYACWGATHFLKLLLAQVNIPVEYFVITPGHRLPRFVSVGLALSHGDDLYNGHFKNTTTFPSNVPYNELFITESKFLEWFGPQTTQEERGKNVGRRMSEIAVQYLSFPLITDWCNDIEEGNSIEESLVYESLKDHFTLVELTQMQLWQKMTGKIASLEHDCQNLWKYYE